METEERTTGIINNCTENCMARKHNTSFSEEYCRNCQHKYDGIDLDALNGMIRITEGDEYD